MSDLLRAAQKASESPLVNRRSRTSPTIPSSPPTKPPTVQSSDTWGSRHVRKTLHLQKDLLEQARSTADRQGISLSAFVNQALSEALK